MEIGLSLREFKSADIRCDSGMCGEELEEMVPGLAARLVEDVDGVEQVASGERTPGSRNERACLESLRAVYLINDHVHQLWREPCGVGRSRDDSAKAFRHVFVLFETCR